MPLLPAPSKNAPPSDPFAAPGQTPSFITGPKKAKPAPKSRVTSHPVSAPTEAAPGQTFEPVGGGPIQTQPLPTTGPPLPALQKFGVTMSIDDINKNVAGITQAHQATFGYSPSAGMVYDILKAQGVTGPVDYTQLFGIPTSQRDAQSKTIAGANPETGVVQVPKVGELISSMTDAIKADRSQASDYSVNFQAWEATNNELIKQAINNPQERDQLVKAMLSLGVTQPMPMLVQASQYRSGGISQKIFSAATLPIAQIADSTVTMPFATYKIFKAAGMDSWDVASAPLSVLVPVINKAGFGLAVPKNKITQATHLATIGKQVGEGMWYDVQHPTTRPGYLAMDLWAVGTAGVGSVVRADAAVGALRAGDIAGATRAIVLKRPPSSTDFAYGAYQESLPLSDTQIVRVLQEKFPVLGRDARAARLAQDQTDGFAVGSANDNINRIFGSTESMMRRNAERRVAISTAVELTPTAEMVRLTRNAAIAKDVWTSMLHDKKLDMSGFSATTKTGVQKAIQLLFSDSEDPVAEWTTHHQNEISALKNQIDALPEANTPEEIAANNDFKNKAAYSIAAHEAQLRAIDPASKIIENPPPRFQPLLDKAYEVRDQIEQMKRTIQGTDDDLAIEHLNKMFGTHIADVGSFIRGENVIKGFNGEKFVTDVPKETTDLMINEAKKAQTRLQAATSKLAKRQAALRLHPTHDETIKSVQDAQRVVAKRNDELGSHQRALQKLQDEGRPQAPIIGDDTFNFGPEAVQELRGTRGSAHFTTQPRIYKNKRSLPSGGYRGALAYTPPNFPYKTWTGESLKLGDFEWDITNQLAGEMPTVYKAAQRKVQYDAHWASGVDRPITPYHRPVLDIKQAPENLRIAMQALDRQQLDSKFAEIVTDKNSDALHDYLYPKTTPELGPHVRFFDERMMMDTVEKSYWQNVDKFFSSAMTPINEPMRLALIFATPAYALNALGAASTLLIKDGFLAPLNLGRAMMSHKLYGAETTRLFDALSGETFTGSLASEMNAFTKGSRGLAHQWQKITDVQFRRAAVISELKRAGLLKDKEISTSDLYDVLRSPENSAKVNQAAQTARKAMLDFNSMSWPERATLRHMFFVYSFLRSSGIWSLRFLRDHGVMSDVLAQEGKGYSDNLDKLIGPMPYWFTHGPGYFAVNKNLVVNPIQWNMPGMLEQIGAPLSSAFNSTPYSSIGDLLGPAAQFGLEAVTGKDSSGDALPVPTGPEKNIPGSGGTIERSILSLFNQTPVGQVLTKQAKVAKQAQHPIPPAPVDSSYLDPISAANTQNSAALKQSVFENDGFWNQWGMTLLRSGEPRKVDAMAGAARYWRDLKTTNPDAYHQHQLDQVRVMVKNQEKVVGEPIPVDAQLAADMVSKVDIALETYQEQNPGAPSLNQKSKNIITLDSLAQQGHIKDKASWLKRINDAPSWNQKGVQTEMLTAAGGLAWKNWVDRVDTINKYALPKYTEATTNLKTLGLGDYSSTVNLPRETKWAYGRQSEDILDQAKELKAAVGTGTGYTAQAATQKWIEFVNTHDKPITINGKTFPSPFAYQLASATDTERAKAIATYVKKSPGTMTSLQAEILTGAKPNPVIAQARETLNTWMASEQAKLPFGKKLPPGTKTYYENFIASKIPAYKAALTFQRLPLAKRMEVYLPIKNSANAKSWDLLLTTASQRYDELAKSYTFNGKVRQSLVTDAWKRDVPKVMKALKENTSKSFMSELRLYTGATTDANSDAHLDKFLVKLVQP